MKCEKNHTNMERMAEQVPEQAYHQYYNFLSESKWDYQEVNDRTALEASALIDGCKAKSGKPTGLIIDESSHLKKGKESVAVAPQYAGVCGKYAYFQCSRYWVERSFDDAKNELGLSGYQVRKWKYRLIHNQSFVPIPSLVKMKTPHILAYMRCFV